MGNKIGRKLSELELLEGGYGGSGMMGGGGGGGGKASSAPAAKASINPKPAGSKRAQDQKEFLDKEPEISGKMRFKSADKYDDYGFGSKTPGFSDDYAKGGSVKKYAAGGYVKAADGIAQRGKTRGKIC